MKKSEGLSESGNTLQDRCPTRKRWVVETQCRKMKFRKKRSFQHNPKQTIICEAQARSELEEFKIPRGKRERSKRSCSSEKEHKVNALAPRADEGRDNLRKAAVSWK